MIRFLAKLTINILANTIGLLAAAIILDNFSINGLSFVVAVIIFSVSTLILSPFIQKTAEQNASYLVGGIALITTLIGLVITNIFTDGISISGLNTWVFATLIVWIFSVIGSVILPIFIFKKTLQKVRS